MKKMAPNHPQLSLPFDSDPQPESASCPGSDSSGQTVATEAVKSEPNDSSVILNFQAVFSKRQAATNASTEAGLYRRILDTVRHIG
jgi:hypothetical protein